MNIIKHETDEFIRKLKLYNSWRRGDEGLAQPNPAEIGLLIDWACAAVEELLYERDEARGQWKEQHDALLTVIEHGENEMQKLIKERDEAKEHLLASKHFLEKYIAERDEAIADRDIARLRALESDRAHDRMVGELEGVYRQRDEARNKMADALQELDLRTLDFERMKQDRDEAREELIYEAAK